MPWKPEFQSDLAENITQPFPQFSNASDKIWLRLAHWLRRYSCLKVLTHGRTDAHTDGRRLDWYTISSPCEPSAQVSLQKATRQYVPRVCWRYIDDIFMIWPHSLEELYSFLSALNDFHPAIKFMSNISQTEVNFLDVTVYKDRHRNIETGLYTKPTDAHLYLHYSSYHLKHQKKSIPYSQAI